MPFKGQVSDLPYKVSHTPLVCTIDHCVFFSLHSPFDNGYKDPAPLICANFSFCV